MDDHTVQGTWMPQEAILYMNLLELGAIQEACKTFLPVIPFQHVLIMLDNLYRKVNLWNWYIQDYIILSAVDLPGAQNSLVDILSRHFLPSITSGNYTIQW